MAFPSTVFTTGEEAKSAIANQAITLGFTTDNDMSVDNVETALVANLVANKTQTLTAGVGITAAAGVLCKTSVTNEGGLIITRFLIDLTGLAAAAAGDIIGKPTGAGVAYIGQITAAVNGTIKGGRMICFEAPAGGDADIDLYAADEATGKYDDAISGLTETQAINSGTQSLGSVSVAIADSIAANQYLYLVSVGSTAATYTAGRVLIELFGV